MPQPRTLLAEADDSSLPPAPHGLPQSLGPSKGSQQPRTPPKPAAGKPSAEAKKGGEGAGKKAAGKRPHPGEAPPQKGKEQGAGKTTAKTGTEPPVAKARAEPAAATPRAELPVAKARAKPAAARPSTQPPVAKARSEPAAAATPPPERASSSRAARAPVDELLPALDSVFNCLVQASRLADEAARAVRAAANQLRDQ